MHSSKLSTWLIFAVVCALPVGSAVTIRNDTPRRDSSGQIVDAHSGNLVQHNGTFYLYGERYRNATGMDYDWVQNGYAPKLTVYASTDLIQWEDRGLCLPDSNSSTQWCPSVVYDGRRQRFVAWWAGMQVATSEHGIHFEQRQGTVPTQLGPDWDSGEGTLFIDDDGTGYIIFAVSPTSAGRNASSPGHRVAISRLNDDYTNTTELVAGFFPDTFVEAPSMFKRAGLYYASYGTCCCACREGSGAVIFSAPNVRGPWTRQTAPHPDINCRNQSAPRCPGSAFFPSADPTNNPTIAAQGFSINPIQTATGVELIWLGDRWLQGPGNNRSCTNLCYKPAPAACTLGQQQYRVGRDPTYWTPLEFDGAGRVLPLQWRDSFDLELM